MNNEPVAWITQIFSKIDNEFLILILWLYVCYIFVLWKNKK